MEEDFCVTFQSPKLVSLFTGNQVLYRVSKLIENANLFPEYPLYPASNRHILQASFFLALF